MNSQCGTHFTTHDLPLVASMVSLGHKIDQITRDGMGVRATFYFRRSDELQTHITAYWKQELLISPKTLFEGLKFAKSLLYSGLER